MRDQAEKQRLYKEIWTRVARQGALRWVIAVGSGAPIGWPGAHLDGRARRAGTGAHPRAGADRVEPESDRSLGQYPQGERRGGRGDHAELVRQGQRRTTSPASYPPHTTRIRTKIKIRKNPRKKSRCCGAIRTRWPTWLTRFSSSTSTRRASSPGRRRTTRARHKLAAWWTSSRKPPGRASNRIPFRNP